MKQAEIIYALAIIGTGTPKEIANFWGVENNTTVSKQALTLFRENMLVRRKVETDRNAKSPFEYRLRNPDTIEDLHVPEIKE